VQLLRIRRVVHDLAASADALRRLDVPGARREPVDILVLVCRIGLFVRGLETFVC